MSSETRRAPAAGRTGPPVDGSAANEMTVRRILDSVIDGTDLAAAGDVCTDEAPYSARSPRIRG
jgi:hypothetical protein